MAVGLIKTKWVHSSKNSPSKSGESPIRAWWNKTRKANERRIEEAQKNYNEQMREFKNQEFTNVYRDVKNPMENLQTEFENTYEDLTVNQQQAQFEKDMAQQQQANIMDTMSAAAGGSGIAALAQQMAQSGQQQAQRASASIGQQEAANQRAAAQGAQQVQQMEAGAQEKVLGGAAQAQAMRLQGEADKQQFGLDKQATLLGMSQQQLGTAMDIEAQRKSDKAAMWSNLLSDVRLKEKIERTGTSPSGIPIYEFNYIGGDNRYSGAMAQDLIEMGIDAVAVESSGYYSVNYNNIDVDMNKIN